MKWVITIALLATIASAGASQASVEIIGDTSTSTGHLDDFMGTANYNATTDILTVTLENTLAPTGNLITGFAFDAPTGHTATLEPNPTGGFENLVNPSTAPFGTFTSGAALGGNWLGGGNPNSGIALDQTESFTFLVTGAHPNLLTTESFLPGDFAVRFRGGNGSDKVLSQTAHGVIAPLPGGIWTGLLTLLVVAASAFLKPSRKTVA